MRGNNFISDYVSSREWIHLVHLPGPPKKNKLLPKKFLVTIRKKLNFSNRKLSHPYERTDSPKKISYIYLRKHFFKRNYFLYLFERTTRLEHSPGPTPEKEISTQKFLILNQKIIFFLKKKFTLV